MSGALTFAGVDLLTGVGGTYKLRALGSLAGTSLVAAPVPIVAALESFLQDGAVVATTGHGNRTLPLVVRVTAADEEGLAAGEAALVGACAATWGAGAVAELAWTRPTGAACVFEVVAAALESTQWHDMAEVPDTNGSPLVATYLLTLTCLPWVKSSQSVTVSIAAPANTVPPTVTLVDDCSSTTGWAASPAGSTLTQGTDPVSGNYVTATNTTQAVTLTRTFTLAQSMTGTPYLKVRAASSLVSASGQPLFKINGTAATPISTAGDAYWFYVGAGPVNSLSVTGPKPLWTGRNAIASVFSISRADAVETSQKEVSRFFAVQGSVRAPASIQLNGINPATSAPAALGDTLVYTSSADNGALALKQYAGSGGSSDGAAYSNNAWDLSTPILASLTASQINTSGYLVVARVKSTTVATKTINVKWNTGVLRTLATDTRAYATANQWQLITLGVAPLPGAVLENPGAAVQLRMDGDSGLVVDDVWLFDLDNGQVSIVSASTSVGLWLDSPSAQHPSPAIWLSGAWARGNGQQATSEIVAWGAHQFAAGGVNVFVAAATPVNVDLTYTPRWHTRARALT